MPITIEDIQKRDIIDLQQTVKALKNDLERFMCADLSIHCDLCGRVYPLPSRTVPPKLYKCAICKEEGR